MLSDLILRLFSITCKILDSWCIPWKWKRPLLFILWYVLLTVRFATGYINFLTWLLIGWQPPVNHSPCQKMAIVIEKLVSNTNPWKTTWWSIYRISCASFTHIFQIHVTGRMTNIYLYQCYWRNPKEYKSNQPLHTYKKYNKTRILCAFLGI